MIRTTAINLVVAVVAMEFAVEVPGRLLLYVAARMRAPAVTMSVGPEFAEKLRHDFSDPQTRIQYDYDMFLGWRARPRQRGATYVLNGWGRRDVEEYSGLTGPAVFLTGGSAAWSVGASDNSHGIAGQLERLLRERGSKGGNLKVLNVAEQAYGLRQETLAVVDTLRMVLPSVVVFLDGVNDAHTILMGRDPERFRTYGDFPEILRAVLAESTGEHMISAESLLGKSVTWRIGRRLWRRMTDSTAGPRPRITDQEATQLDQFFRMQLRGLDGLLGRQGIRTVFALQPVAYVKRRLAPAEQLIVADGYAGWWRSAYEVLEQSYAEARIVDGVAAISLAEVFGDDGRQVFIDPMHLNDLGNEIVAEALASALASALPHQ